MFGSGVSSKAKPPPQDMTAASIGSSPPECRSSAYKPELFRFSPGSLKGTPAYILAYIETRISPQLDQLC